MSPFVKSRVVVWTAVTVALAALTGCGEDSPPSTGSMSTAPTPHAAPTAAADCNDLGAQRADGYVLAGTDWSNEMHTYAEPAVVYVCVAPGTSGRVSLETSGQGITVSPRSRPASSSKTGVLPFRVRVARGAEGTLAMRQKSPGASGGGPGPTVVAEADGWHFTSAG